MNGRITGTYRYTYNYYTIINSLDKGLYGNDWIVIICISICTSDSTIHWTRASMVMTGTYRYTYNYYTIITIEALVQ
jgi:disulfide oxidoreductase YuzD